MRKKKQSPGLWKTQQHTVVLDGLMDELCQIRSLLHVQGSALRENGMVGVQVLDEAGDANVTSSFVGYNLGWHQHDNRVQPDVTEAGPQSRVRRGLQHFGVVVRLGGQL